MSAEKYPLVRAAGLKARPCCWNELKGGHNECISPQEVQAWLAAAPVWYGRLPGPGATVFKWYEVKREGCTHTARGVCIEPIVRESEERQLLRQMLAGFDLKTKHPVLHVVDTSIIERARKLLEREG